jgi:hypothetical protein
MLGAQGKLRDELLNQNMLARFRARKIYTNKRDTSCVQTGGYKLACS